MYKILYGAVSDKNLISKEEYLEKNEKSSGRKPLQTKVKKTHK